MSDERKAPMTSGELWSWVRSVMSQATSIRCDYDAGAHKGYEAYSARLDAAASERADELWARLHQSAADALEAADSERAAAWKVGAEAMREAAADEVDRIRRNGDMPFDDAIRALPLPTMANRSVEVGPFNLYTSPLPTIPASEG